MVAPLTGGIKMQRILSAVSALMLGLAVILTSVASSFAAPISPQPVQLTSNVENIHHRRWHNPPGHRYGWNRSRHSEWRRDRDRRDWRRDRYHRRHWAERRDDRRWSHNRRYYRSGSGYMGGSGRSHQ
jgi:hypothetical protein